MTDKETLFSYRLRQAEETLGEAEKTAPLPQKQTKKQGGDLTRFANKKQGLGRCTINTKTSKKRR